MKNIKKGRRILEVSNVPNVSSNVLFHFTGSFNNVISIMEHGFFPRYCPEYGIFDDVLKNEQKLPPSYARAMVSFCDLPLPLIKRHLIEYGPYAIGLDKTWRTKHGVSPLLYIHQNSRSLHTIQRMTSNIPADEIRRGNVALDQIHSLMAVVKPYEGPAWRQGSMSQVSGFMTKGNGDTCRI